MVKTLSVTEFLRGVNDVLAGVPALVEGELSGFALRQERWAFFSLKDEESVVECFMPAWKLKHEVTDGMVVRVAGVPQVYAKSGRFRIVVEALEPVGEGSLRRAFELLKQKLEREGLFASARKRTLPRFPEVIGLIASRESAAYSDFIRILKNRWGGVRVLVADVAVQGADAVEDIVGALRHWQRAPFPTSLRGAQSATKQSRATMGEIATLASLARNDIGLVPDVLVLTRGGGSLEDLQAFNSEEVARAIFASSVPVVVGVGHERDVTIADLVADVRASTPSNAAELVVPDRRDVRNEIEAMAESVTGRVTLTIAQRQGALERFVHRGASFAQRRRAAIDATIAMFARRMNERLLAIRGRLDTAARLIANLNPSRLLERGYSMTFTRGRLVRGAAALAIGDRLTTRFGDGTTESTVAETRVT